MTLVVWMEIDCTQGSTYGINLWIKATEGLVSKTGSDRKQLAFFAWVHFRVIISAGLIISTHLVID